MASPCWQLDVNVIQADDINLQLMSRHAGVTVKLPYQLRRIFQPLPADYYSRHYIAARDAISDAKIDKKLFLLRCRTHGA